MMLNWKQELRSECQFPLVIAAALTYEIKSLRKSKIPGCVYLTTGMGAKNTNDQLRSSLSRKTVKGLLFVGLAGALSPTLKIGDIVVAQKLLNSNAFNPSAQLISIAKSITIQKNPVKTASVATVRSVICSAIDRKNLADTLPLNQNEIMDMESSAVNEACSQLQIPFIIVRAVSDLYGEGLPLDFNTCLNSLGNVSIPKILISLAKRPQAIPEVLRLKKRTQFCMERLSSFLEQFVKNIPS